MSTSSSATALGRDQVPSDDPHLKTKICVFIVTRKDGTPYDVTSVTEEDIMEICVTLGHTHPLGVFQYLVMESVALFHMAEERQWASHGAMKAMELWDEPSEHHIRAYITIVGGDHSKQQSLSSEGEGDPHSPTGNPHPGGSTPHHLQAELGDLIDQEPASTCGGSPSEIALCELHSPLSNPQQTPWGEPSGSGNLNGDEPEVTFPRGEGGFPRDNHLQLLFQHDQMEDGFLRDHLLSPQGLLWQIQMWGTLSTL